MRKKLKADDQKTITDEMLMMLYMKMTGSNLMGDFEDDYVLSVLYAMRCVDCFRNMYNVIKPSETAAIGKLVLDIYESSPSLNMDYVSIEAWCQMLMNYMDDNKLRLKKIIAMDRNKLLNILKESMQRQIDISYMH